MKTMREVRASAFWIAFYVCLALSTVYVVSVLLGENVMRSYGIYFSKWHFLGLAFATYLVFTVTYLFLRFKQDRALIKMRLNQYTFTTLVLIGGGIGIVFSIFLMSACFMVVPEETPFPFMGTLHVPMLGLFVGFALTFILSLLDEFMGISAGFFCGFVTTVVWEVFTTQTCLSNIPEFAGRLLVQNALICAFLPMVWTLVEVIVLRKKNNDLAK